MKRIILFCAALISLTSSALADSFSPGTVAPGGSVTLSGQAKPNSAMSGYFSCSNSCGQTHIGVAQVNAQGQYSLTFKIPANANAGEGYVQVGCDTCGNGWRTVRGLQISNAAAQPQPVAAPNGICRDPWVTQAIKEVTGRSPNGTGDTGECNYMLYGHGQWNSYDDLKAKVRAALNQASAQAPVQAPQAPNGNCRDPWVTRAIKETIGRDPNGSGDTGECNYMNYGNGHWSDYEDLKRKVFYKINGIPFRCFGAVGSNCTGLVPSANSNSLVPGRTNLSNGHYALWVSVGSIKHDSCCSLYGNGKMCGGAPGASQATKDAANDLFKNGDGRCVEEWDKAWWNSIDGRAWSKEFDPNEVPNIDNVANPRQSKSRNGIQLVTFETAATRGLSAPSGQALDPQDREYCASGQFSDERWCTAGGALCSSLSELNGAKQAVKDWENWRDRKRRETEEAIRKCCTWVTDPRGPAMRAATESEITIAEADHVAKMSNVTRLEGIYNTRHTHWGVCK